MLMTFPQFAALCWCLPILVGAEVDFPTALKTGEAAEEAPEGAESSSRQTRQSAAPESYSFQVRSILLCYFSSYLPPWQSIRIGADAAEELQLDAPATEAQAARAPRQFSLNVQFPSGFNSNTNPSQFAQQNPSQFGQQSPSQFSQQQTPFQNFPSFTQSTQSTLQQSLQQTRCGSLFVVLAPCEIMCTRTVCMVGYLVCIYRFSNWKSTIS